MNIIGISIICLSLFITVAIATYSPLNCSFNTVHNYNEPNLFFYIMYCTSDIIVQLFGNAFYLFNFVLLVHGIKIARKKTPSKLIKRISASFIAVIILSYLLTMNNVYSGLTGYSILCYVSPLVVKYKSGIILINLFSTLTCFALTCYSIEYITFIKEFLIFIKENRGTSPRFLLLISQRLHIQGFLKH